MLTGRMEGNILFNDALNTFYLRLYGVTHMVKDHSDSKRSRCRHIGYYFRLAARVLLYASSHRQNNTYHGLCYTSRGALVGTRNKKVNKSRRKCFASANDIEDEFHFTPICPLYNNIRKEGSVLFNDALNTFYLRLIWRRTYGSTMKDRSDDPSHHKLSLSPQSYISLPNNIRKSLIKSYYWKNPLFLIHSIV